MGWHKVPHQIQSKVTRFPNLPCYFVITVPTRNTLKLDHLGFIYKGTVFQGEGRVSGCQYLRAGRSGAVTTQKLRGQGEGIVQNPEGKSYERGCHRKSNVLLWWDPDPEVTLWGGGQKNEDLTSVSSFPLICGQCSLG